MRLLCPKCRTQHWALLNPPVYWDAASMVFSTTDHWVEIHSPGWLLSGLHLSSLCRQFVNHSVSNANNVLEQILFFQLWCILRIVDAKIFHLQFLKHGALCYNHIVWLQRDNFLIYRVQEIHKRKLQQWYLLSKAWFMNRNISQSQFVLNSHPPCQESLPKTTTTKKKQQNILPGFSLQI